MAVVYVQEFKVEPGDRSTTNYDAVAARLGDASPDGLVVHTAGFDDDAGVFRIADVWESQEQAQRFIDEELMPIIEEVMAAQPEGTNLEPPSREGFYEVHHIIRP
jgi:hypothetical protein